MKKKGTSTKKIKAPTPPTAPQVGPNTELAQFIKDKRIDFQVSVFDDKYVHIPGQGFLFFDKPQLIYKATRKE